MEEGAFTHSRAARSKKKKKTVCEAENKMQGRERKSPPVFSENTFGPGKYRESVDALFSFFFYS